MFERNKYKYAKERDEHINILKRPWRFTMGEVMSCLGLSLEKKDIYRECFLFNRSKNRRPKAIKIKRSKKMTK